MKTGKAIPVLIFVTAAFLFPAGEGNTLFMTDAMGRIYWVSSELSPSPEGFGKYGGHHLFDGDKKTAWVEGVPGAGIGERIRVIVPGPLDHIAVVNGYAKSPGIFRANNRVREIRVSAFAVRMPPEGRVTEKGTPVTFLSRLASFPVTLEDTAATRKISLPQTWREKTAGQYPIAMEIEIRSVYPGARFDDTCLSELTLVFDRKTRVEIRNRDAEVWIIRDGEPQLVTRKTDSVFQLIETDRESHWAILIEMPGRTEGRVETRYRLLAINAGRFVSLEKLGAGVNELYGFETRGGKLYLRAGSSRDSGEIHIDLEAVQP